MKIALVGSSGNIAGFLLQRFGEQPQIDNVLKIDQTSDADQIIDLLKADEFDYSVLSDVDSIVFTAAISGPDRCAADFNYCWKINVDGTIYFIQKAVEMGCKVLFFSSDAVFGDIQGQIYTEESDTSAATPYGRMKKAVEDEFKNNPKFKSIRLSYVVSMKDRFVTYCLNCIKNNEAADIFHPFYRNCIVVSDVADVVMWLLTHWEEYKPFALNVAGKELVSRVRIADELNRFLKNKLKYSVTMPEQEFFINRPKITQMKSLYMQEYHILEDDSFTEKIQKELKGMKR